jgi:hypothetical protein
MACLRGEPKDSTLAFSCEVPKSILLRSELAGEELAKAGSKA